MQLGFCVRKHRPFLFTLHILKQKSWILDASYFIDVHSGANGVRSEIRLEEILIIESIDDLHRLIVGVDDMKKLKVLR